MALQAAAHLFPLEFLQGRDKKQHAGIEKTVKNNIFGKVTVFKAVHRYPMRKKTLLSLTNFATEPPIEAGFDFLQDFMN